MHHKCTLINVTHYLNETKHSIISNSNISFIKKDLAAMGYVQLAAIFIYYITACRLRTVDIGSRHWYNSTT